MALNIQVFLARFAGEAVKHCDQLEKEILTLESAGVSAAMIDSLFRTAHTLKGAARMLKLSAIAEVAHRMEDVLEKLRSNENDLSQEVIDLLLESVDAIRGLVDLVAAGTPLPESLPAVCFRLEKLLKPDTEPKRPLPFMDDFPEENQDAGEKKEPAALQTEFVPIRAERLDEIIQLMGEMVSFQYRKTQQNAVIRNILRLSSVSLELAAKQKLTYPQGEIGSRELADTLSVLHSQLRKFQDTLRNDAVVENLLTTDLQERSLKIRMLPLTTVFDKMNRAVRDLARTTGKDVEFQIAGGDTELDRKIIERLGDSLLHMVRNAVDHGIETPENRARAGKKTRGAIHLSATYDAGGVILVLQDDGAGISAEQMKRTAIQKRLLNEAAAEQLTETEALELIFLPGFSTSPLITDLSGRGVGMNVVRQTIVEELKGSVRIRSRIGEGTSFILKVPITLALSRMLIVSAAGHSFAVPAYSVQEVLLVPASQIIPVVDKRALRVREHLVSLEELENILQCPQAEVRERDKMLVVILVSGAERLGLIVDAMISEADMVIRSLPTAIKHLTLLAGFAVGSDDEIISVLGVAALIRQAREGKAGARPPGNEAAAQRKSILVVDDSANTRDIVQSILESYGYQVDLAEDGMAAIIKTDRRVYDLVVTDVEMPHLDGFSLTAHLRQDDRYRQIPVIIVTSREKEEDKRRGIQVGANAYIVKGAFDQNNLLETVRNLIG